MVIVFKCNKVKGTSTSEVSDLLWKISGGMKHGARGP